MANESSAYEDWRNYRVPHLLDILEEFPSCQPPASLLIAHLTPLQPRFYSISSSPKKCKNEIHLTVAVVKYKTQDGNGSEHFGVCSNYLENLKADDNLIIFVRRFEYYNINNDNNNKYFVVRSVHGYRI